MVVAVTLENFRCAICHSLRALLSNKLLSMALEKSNSEQNGASLEFLFKHVYTIRNHNIVLD